MRTKTLTIRILERRLFTSLVAALVMLGALYSYFVVSSIVNVIVREEMEQEIATISSSLSDLEFSYIERQHTIDMPLAHQLGFVKISEKQYVTRRAALGGGLTLGEEPR